MAMRDLIEIFEAQEYFLLENDQRAAWIEKNFGAKILAKYESEKESLPTPVVATVNRQEGENDLQKLVNLIMSVDPTPTKAYARWIALRYYKNDQQIEDMDESLSRSLQNFMEATRSGRLKMNIDQLKTFSDLHAAVEDFNFGDRETSGKKDRKNNRDTSVDTKVAKLWTNDPEIKDCEVVLDNDDWMVIIPKTFEASKHFGANTAWCTTSMQYGDMFASYSAQGPIYTILRRKDGVKFQFHFESHQFMDRNDRGIDLTEFVKSAPAVVDAIGREKFINLAVDGLTNPRPYAQLSIDAFDRSDIEALVDDKTIGRAIRVPKMFDFFSKKRLKSMEVLEECVAASRWLDDKTYPPRLISTYAGWFPDPKDWMTIMRRSLHVLKLLPPEMQTDELKLSLSVNTHASKDIATYIPKPWPRDIQEYYYASAARNGEVRLSEVPREFWERGVFLGCFLEYPEDVGDFPEVLSDDLVETVLTQLCLRKQIYAIENFVKFLPEKFLSRNIYTILKTKMNEQKSKESQWVRDAYLLIMKKNFPWEWHPKGAHKMIGRMHDLTDKFDDHPEDEKTIERAMTWVRYNTKRLSELPAEMVTPEVVRSAIFENESLDKDSIITTAYSVLYNCDPKVVTAEIVSPILREIYAKQRKYFDRYLIDFPPEMIDRELREFAVSKGWVPFDNPLFDKDLMTPQAVAFRFNHTVPATMDGRYEDKADGRVVNSGPASVPNIEEIKKAWESLPEGIDKKEIFSSLIAIGKGDAKHGNHHGSYSRDMGEDYLPLIGMVPKSYLDAETLTRWIAPLRPYSSAPDQPKIEAVRKWFKKFPKESYTSENMEKAVELKLITKVPDNLINNDVIMARLNDYGEKKKIDLTTLDEGFWIEYANKHPKEVMSPFVYNQNGMHRKWDEKEADHLKSIANSLPFVKTVLIQWAKTKDKPFYNQRVETNQIKQVWGEHPELRKNWDQKLYEAVAGRIFTLDMIPEKFRSPVVIKRCYEAHPLAVSHDSNPLNSLNGQDPALDDRKVQSVLAHGYAKVGGKYIDLRGLEKKTVPSAPGSYVVTDLDHKGRAIIFFDDAGEFLLSMTEGYSTRGSYSTKVNAFPHIAAGIGAPSVDTLSRYRKLITGAFAIEKDIRGVFTQGGGGYGDDTNPKEFFNSIGLFYDDSRGFPVPVEKLPRDGTITENLEYTNTSKHWRGNTVWVFKRDTEELLAKCSFDEGANTKLQFAHTDPKAVNFADDFAVMMARWGLANSKLDDFRKSDFFTKLGLRSPGKGSWFTLLEKKLYEKDDLSLWQSDARVTIYHKTMGVLWVAKLTKHGYGIEEGHSVENNPIKSSTASEFFNKAREILGYE